MAETVRFSSEMPYVSTPLDGSYIMIDDTGTSEPKRTKISDILAKVPAASSKTINRDIFLVTDDYDDIEINTVSRQVIVRNAVRLVLRKPESNSADTIIINPQTNSWMVPSSSTGALSMRLVADAGSGKLELVSLSGSGYTPDGFDYTLGYINFKSNGKPDYFSCKHNILVDGVPLISGRVLPERFDKTFSCVNIQRGGFNINAISSRIELTNSTGSTGMAIVFTDFQYGEQVVSIRTGNFNFETGGSGDYDGIYMIIATWASISPGGQSMLRVINGTYLNSIVNATPFLAYSQQIGAFRFASGNVEGLHVFNSDVKVNGMYIS